METKKLSDVTSVAQLGNNDFITCIMSNGEVVKIKALDLAKLILTNNANDIICNNIDFKGQQSKMSSHIFRYENDVAGNVYDHYYETSATKDRPTRAHLRVRTASGGIIQMKFGGDGLFEWNGKDVVLQSKALAASYISERYSIDEEQSITRRMIAKDPTVVEQFNEYNTYCEECKARAKKELANQQ